MWSNLLHAGLSVNNSFGLETMTYESKIRDRFLDHFPLDDALQAFIFE